MNDKPAVPIFDGHNDALLRLRTNRDEGPESFVAGGDRGHLDLPKAIAGGFAGGMFACFTPSPKDKKKVVRTHDGYEEEFPPTPETAVAQKTTIDLAADLFRIEALSAGQFKVARTVDEIESYLKTGTVAATLHIEGAEAIDTELNALGSSLSGGPPFDRPGPGVGRMRLPRACRSNSRAARISAPA